MGIIITEGLTPLEDEILVNNAGVPYSKTTDNITTTYEPNLPVKSTLRRIAQTWHGVKAKNIPQSTFDEPCNIRYGDFEGDFTDRIVYDPGSYSYGSNNKIYMISAVVTIPNELNDVYTITCSGGDNTSTYGSIKTVNGTWTLNARGKVTTIVGDGSGPCDVAGFITFRCPYDSIYWPDFKFELIRSIYEYDFSHLLNVGAQKIHQTEAYHGEDHVSYNVLVTPDTLPASYTRLGSFMMNSDRTLSNLSGPEVDPELKNTLTATATKSGFIIKEGTQISYRCYTPEGTEMKMIPLAQRKIISQTCESSYEDGISYSSSVIETHQTVTGNYDRRCEGEFDWPEGEHKVGEYRRSGSTTYYVQEPLTNTQNTPVVNGELWVSMPIGSYGTTIRFVKAYPIVIPTRKGVKYKFQVTEDPDLVTTTSGTWAYWALYQKIDGKIAQVARTSPGAKGWGEYEIEGDGSTIELYPGYMETFYSGWTGSNRWFLRISEIETTYHYNTNFSVMAMGYKYEYPGWEEEELTISVSQLTPEQRQQRIESGYTYLGELQVNSKGETSIISSTPVEIL